MSAQKKGGTFGAAETALSAVHFTKGAIQPSSIDNFRILIDCGTFEYVYVQPVFPEYFPSLFPLFSRIIPFNQRPHSAPPVTVINDTDSQYQITSSALPMIVPPEDIYDRSSTTTPVDDEPVVGSISAQDGQRWLRLVNSLHDIE
jgi:hypothetical protein